MPCVSVSQARAHCPLPCSVSSYSAISATTVQSSSVVHWGIGCWIGCYMPCDPSVSGYRKKPWASFPPSPPPTTFHTSVASTANSQRSLNSSISRFSKLSTADQRGCLSFGFSFFLLFFFKRTSVALFKLWEVEDYTDLGTPCQEILPSLRTLTNEAERTLDLPRRRNRHGLSPWLSTE